MTVTAEPKLKSSFFQIDSFSLINPNNIMEKFLEILDLKCCNFPFSQSSLMSHKNSQNFAHALFDGNCRYF